MSLGIFSPYGRVSAETGFIMVLARYLARRGYGLVNILCNGTVPRCGRDLAEEGGRMIDTCARCIVEQRQGAEWSGLSSLELSPFFAAGDFADHQNRIAQFPPGDLAQYQSAALRVSEVRNRERLKVVADDATPGEGREATLLVARTLDAFSRLMQERQFDAVFSPAGDDYYLNSFAAVAERSSIPHFRFAWEISTRSMKITGSPYGEVFKSNLFFDDIDSMRADVDSWPEEIRSQLKAVEGYLGITQQQLSLPIN